MKLTKEQVTEKRKELCKVFVAMNKQRRKSKSKDSTARLLRSNSPTGFPKRPVSSVPIARGVRFNRPQGFEDELTGFLRGGGGPLTAGRRDFNFARTGVRTVTHKQSSLVRPCGCLAFGSAVRPHSVRQDVSRTLPWRYSAYAVG